MSVAFKGIARGLGALGTLSNRVAILKREAYGDGTDLSLTHTVYSEIMTPNYSVKISVRYDIHKDKAAEVSLWLSLRGPQLTTDGFVSIIESKPIARGIREGSLQKAIVEYLNSTNIVELRNFDKNIDVLAYNKLYTDTVYHLADVSSVNSGLMVLRLTEVGRAITINRGTSGGMVLAKIYLEGDTSVRADGSIFRVKYTELHETAKSYDLERGDVISLKNLKPLETAIRGLHAPLPHITA